MRQGEVNVITLGCAKNLTDSEQLMKMFASAGYQVRHDPRRVTGEIVVVNTCGFIAAAQEESINMILSLVQAKNKGQIRKLFVMGCLSERFRGDLEKELPEVDAFYGKFDWKKILSELGHGHKAMLGDRLLTTPRHYAYVKISEGCNQHCSYCAIPLITGAMKSRSIQEIVHEVKELVSKGCREFQLIAQDLTSYGRDIKGHSLLPELLLRLSDLQGVQWIRLHYAYPTLFPLEILPIIRERDNLCKYLDIALQHGSDHILRLMRRGITQQATKALIQQIRDEVPGIVLRTTFMVGHPGETEQDFEELLHFAEEVRFERMGAFVYSHEKDTYSYQHYQDDIPMKVKLSRYERLMDLQLAIGESFSKSLVGKELEVVIDRHEKGYYVGRTQYDSPEVDPEVIVYEKEGSNRLQVGSFYPMKIVGTESFDLVAQPIISTKH